MTTLLPQTLALLWLALAVVLELSGSYLLKLSDGLRRRLVGGTGITCVIGSFAALSQAIKGMELAVAYAVWGGVGLVTTALIGAFAFGQHIKPAGWLGMALVLGGVLALKLG